LNTKLAYTSLNTEFQAVCNRNKRTECPFLISMDFFWMNLESCRVARFFTATAELSCKYRGGLVQVP